jgi:hypothetical protein
VSSTGRESTLHASNGSLSKFGAIDPLQTSIDGANHRKLAIGDRNGFFSNDNLEESVAID